MTGLKFESFPQLETDSQIPQNCVTHPGYSLVQWR